MKKLLLVALLSICAISASNAMYEYENIITEPLKVQMNDVDIYAIDNAIAVGDFGVVKIFDDMGINVTYSLIEGKANLNSVKYLTDDRIVVVGDNGSAFYSNDRGKSWIRSNTNTYENLNSLKFFDSNIGFAVGNEGVIIKTEDGGKNWDKLSIGVNADLNDIDISPSNLLCVVGSGGTVLTSTNFGLNWENINQHNSLNFIYVKANKDNIIIIPESLSFYSYNLKLNYWDVIEVEKNYNKIYTNAKITSVFFKNELEGVIKVNDLYACSPLSYDYYTKDGGESWTSINNNQGGFYDRYPFTTVCMDFIDDDFGILISKNDGDYVCKYDSKISYAKKEFVYQYSYNNLAVKNGNVAISYDYGTPVGLLKSDNSETQWSDLKYIDTIGIKSNYMLIDDLEIINDNTMLVIANDSKSETTQNGNTTIIKTIRKGIILKTENDCNDWSVYRIPDQESADKISMYSSDYGLLKIGSKSKYMVTKDGGTSWNYIAFPDSNQVTFIENIYCDSPDNHIILAKNLDTITNVYFIKGENEIYKKISLPPYHHDLKYYNDNLIYAFGNPKNNSNGDRSVSISKSIDGGISWINIFTDSYQDYNYYKAWKSISSNNIIAYSYVNLYFSSNMGSKWNKIPTDFLNLKSNEFIEDVEFNNENELILISSRHQAIKIFLNELSSNNDKDYTSNVNNISISPNPASEYITINFQRCATLQKCGTSEIEIYDVMGVKIQSDLFPPMTPSHRMNVGNLAPGVYFVKIGEIVEKFVKY